MDITVREALRVVRGRINGCESYDRERLLDTLHLAQIKAWNSGKWYGMMGRMVVRVIDGRIVLPSEYGVMEAINFENVPKQIHPIWYDFSPNGPSTSDCWEHKGIFDLREVPTVWKVQQGEKIIAVSTSKNSEDSDVAVTIQGTNSDGREIYRYYTEDDCGTPIKKSDKGEQIGIAMLQENCQYSPAYQTHNAFACDGITAILKPQTRGPVTIYATAPRGMRELVTLQPGQQASTLRAYRVPQGCKCNPFVEVLAKKAEPLRPSQDHELIQITNLDALIALCLSVYYEYDTFDPDKADRYLAKGLLSLNGQLQENIMSQQQRPVVWVGASYARNRRRNVNAY